MLRLEVVVGWVAAVWLFVYGGGVLGFVGHGCLWCVWGLGLEFRGFVGELCLVGVLLWEACM